LRLRACAWCRNESGYKQRKVYATMQIHFSNRSIVLYRTGSHAHAMLYIYHKLGPDNPMR